jgi:hypothetical protein
VYRSEHDRLRAAMDANSDGIRTAKLTQDIGERIIEQTVTVIPAVFVDPADTAPWGEPTTESTEELLLDGNCRITTAFSNIPIPVEKIPQRLRGTVQASSGGSGGKTVAMRSSLLTTMTLEERIQLCRDLAKHYTAIVENPRSSVTAHNVAVRALNSLTAPATVIVGFRDDDPANRNSRLGAAARAYLDGMNVENNPLTDPARHSVAAEQVVTKLHEAHVIDGPTRDVLLGRVPASPAMAALEVPLSPLPDLRFALCAQVLTGNDADSRRVLRTKLGVRGGVQVAHRSPLAVELGLRGYTASLEKQRIREMRQALESGSFLWQDLVDYKWQVDDVADDETVDVLKLYADEGHQGALALLGLLGLIALVSTGNLLAAGGSAETVATKLTEADTAVTVDRGNIGNIATRLLKQSWGRNLLADAIKRSRSGDPLRWADPATGELTDPPAEWKGGAGFNAMLRYHLKMAGQTVPSGPTQADREEAAFTNFSNAITDAQDALTRLLGVRSATSEKLTYLDGKGVLDKLERIRKRFDKIVDAPDGEDEA